MLNIKEIVIFLAKFDLEFFVTNNIIFELRLK